ncbi:MAG: ribonuclease E inhibitor RraB [Pseudomonadota bacterium]
MSILQRLLRLFRKQAMGAPASNDAVRAQLTALGDDGAATRHVLHYAYPERTADDADRDSMRNDLIDRGFKVSDAASGNGFVLEHHREVASNDFDALTADLSAWFAARGWDYDGWECAVVTAQDAA